MRPIRLDMHGFASFRDEATVDFTDADFFALVGPTGSGKSTVIDAMTFALYGSVPRWGHRKMVSLALAPTVARGTVKLVFEVDRQRYVVARELRRTGAAVNQRAASLERLADTGGLAMPGEATFPMAKDLDGVNEAVEKLLGLKYDDFIQCVVLPQGQFAAFLHAKPTDRQDILLRLLGAEHYRLMMVKANQRDKMAGLRAGTYGEELLGYADATADAEHAARAAEAALASLGDRVQAALPLLAARRGELADAEGRLRQLRAEAAALAALRVPDGVGQLDADLTASLARVTELRAAERAAEQADGAARDELARGPQRAPLELARAHRAEHARHQAAIAGLAADVAERGARSTAGVGGRGHRRDRLGRGARPPRRRVPRGRRSRPSGSPRSPRSTPGSRRCRFPPGRRSSTSGGRPRRTRSPPRRTLWRKRNEGMSPPAPPAPPPRRRHRSPGPTATSATCAPCWPPGPPPSTPPSAPPRPGTRPTPRWPPPSRRDLTARRAWSRRAALTWSRACDRTWSRVSPARCASRPSRRCPPPCRPTRSTRPRRGSPKRSGR